MTALLISENFPPAIGGTARWFWELYRRLPRTDVVIAAGERAGVVEFDRTHDLRVERLPLSFRDCGLFGWESWRRYRGVASRLRDLIRRHAIDQLHGGRLLPEGWLALRCGRPYACYVHGEELNTAETSRQLTWMVVRVLRRASFLVANSQHTAQLLEHRWHVPPETIRILHPGVDSQRFLPADPDERVRTELGWSGRIVILTVGRLQKRKGHDRMIQAVAALRRDFPSVLYAIIGDGEERGPLQDQVGREGLSDFVRFYGEVDDRLLIGAYQQCDLFVLPNRNEGGDFEGFGMVLLEAQACGKAVVAGDSGGTAETLRAGETGVIARCEDPDELSAAVASLLGDRKRREGMEIAARRWITGRFDFDTLVPAARSLLEFPPR